MLMVFFGCERDPMIIALPTITTGTSTNIGYVTASATFSIVNINAVEQAGIVWDTKSTITSISNYVESSVGEGFHSVNLNSLPSGATIYYKAYAKDGKDDYIYGEVKSFTTKFTSVSVTTGEGTYLGYNSSEYRPYSYSFSASLVGVSVISSWGIIVSTDEDLSYSNNGGRYSFETSGYTQGSLSSLGISWRFPSGRLRVYFRAFAVLNDGGIVYGAVKSVY